MFSLVKIECGLLAIFLLVIFVASPARGQETVDMTVATVNDGVKTELITRSDILWQMAMQPATSIDDPQPEVMNNVLQRLIDQRIFVLESERLPQTPPTETEIAAKIAELVAAFPSVSDFETRLKKVGFASIKDDNFERIIAQRIVIDKYLDFRFRSFIVITAEDEANYYQDVFVPEFRRQYPGLLMPTLSEKRAEIYGELVEVRTAENMSTFLEEAKRRVEVVILNEPS